ncbi:hypothetical protein PMAYCL1PPCAC_17285, partial [Pristionchus mayeri]
LIKMQFEPAFKGHSVPVIGNVLSSFPQKDGSVLVLTASYQYRIAPNGSAHCVKDSSICNALGVIDDEVYVAQKNGPTLSIMKVVFGEDGTYRKDVVQSFSKSDKPVLRNNCLHYFMQSKEKDDVTLAFPIKDHFEDVDGIPFLLPIGELAQMVAVHRNHLYEVRSVNVSKEIWRRASGSEQIEKIPMKTNVEIDRFFCLGGTVIVNDSIQLRVYEVEKFKYEKIIALPGEDLTALFITAISPDGGVLAYTKKVDLDVKAVKGLSFHTSRLPGRVA